LALGRLPWWAALIGGGVARVTPRPNDLQHWRSPCGPLFRICAIVIDSNSTLPIGRPSLISRIGRMPHVATPQEGSPQKSAAKPTASREGRAGTGRPLGSHKAVRLGAAPAAMVGRQPLPRTEMTKNLWEYTRAQGLQDVRNKRRATRMRRWSRSLAGSRRPHSSSWPS
jgi:hypothetical protein